MDGEEGMFDENGVMTLDGKMEFMRRNHVT